MPQTAPTLSPTCGLGEREGTDAFASDGEDGVADSGKNGWKPLLAKSS